MITLAEWKLIGITTIIVFFISAIVYGKLLEIVARIKNKKQKKIGKQITYTKPKNTLKIDYKTFIKANCKKATFLYENRNREAELMRLFNYL